METFRILMDLAAVLAAAIAMGFVFYRLKQPILIGYLIGGLLVGPFGLGFVTDRQTIEMFADLGVILLMFALGVEFSLAKLLPIWRVAALGGLAQISLLILLTVGGSKLLGVSLGAGILLGCVMALSSTVIVLKVLMERGELDSMHGRISLGLLIVQDLAVIPMMVLLPSLQDPTTAMGTGMLLAVGKAVLLLTAIGWLGAKVFPLLMSRVAATKSKELFLLSTVALCFGMASLTYAFGLSFALGAFVAGIVISESDHSHQIMADVLPLRDLFATMFFVSIGMLINPGFLSTRLPVVLGLVVALIVGKALVIFAVTRAFGYSGRTSLTVGLGLAQMGEFSFILAKMGEASGLLSEELFSLILASALVSIILTPSLLSAAVPIYRFALRFPLLRAVLSPGKAAIATAELTSIHDHVVICGFGRVGSNLGEVLIHHQLPVLVIDLDTKVLKSLQERGVKCLYGDAANPEVLRHAMLPLAKLMVIALPDPISCQLALEQAGKLNPKLTLLARAHRAEDLDLLYSKGAAQVIQPEFEASLEAIRFAFMHLGYAPQEILRYISDIRGQHYRQFLDDFRPDAVPDLVATLGDHEMKWLQVADAAALAGQTLEEAGIRRQTGAAVLAIKRDGRQWPNPHAEEVLMPGDQVLVMGEPAQIARLSELLGAAYV